MSRIDVELELMKKGISETKETETKKEKYEKVEDAFKEKPRKLALDVVNDPTPSDAGKIMIGGRPLDVHVLERFMLFETDQRTTPTILRFSESLAALDRESFLTKGGFGMKKGTWKIIVILTIVLIGIFLFWMLGPKLLSGIGGMFG